MIYEVSKFTYPQAPHTVVPRLALVLATTFGHHPIDLDLFLFGLAEPAVGLSLGGISDFYWE